MPSDALKRRVIAAAVLIAAILASVLLLPTWGWALVATVFLVVAAWEWGGLSGIPARPLRVAYVGLFALMAALLTYFEFTSRLVEPLVWFALIWWCYALLAVVRLQRSGSALPRSRFLLGVFGVLVLIPTWSALVWLPTQPQGELLLIGLFGLIWIADSAAYFTGRRFGRRKLAARVSPGKTWEGVIGALLCTAAAAALALGLSGPPPWVILCGTTLCVATVIASIVGDLFESAVKRAAGVKDSSALIPGHGGVLDRIDSLTAAAPIFVLGLGVCAAPQI
jgi:phosphatidate cytidylyltransferase